MLFKLYMRDLGSAAEYGTSALGYQIETQVFQRVSQRLLAPAGSNAPVAATELRLLAESGLEAGALLAEVTLFAEYFHRVAGTPGAAPPIRARRIVDLCRFQALGDVATDLQVPASAQSGRLGGASAFLPPPPRSPLPFPVPIFALCWYHTFLHLCFSLWVSKRVARLRVEPAGEPVRFELKCPLEGNGRSGTGHLRPGVLCQEVQPVEG